MDTHKATLFTVPEHLEFTGSLEGNKFSYIRADGSKGLFIVSPLTEMEDVLAIVGVTGIIGQVSAKPAQTSSKLAMEIGNE